MVCCVPWFCSFTNFLAKGGILEGQGWERETIVFPHQNGDEKRLHFFLIKAYWEGDFSNRGKNRCLRIPAVSPRQGVSLQGCLSGNNSGDFLLGETLAGKMARKNVITPIGINGRFHIYNLACYRLRIIITHCITLLNVFRVRRNKCFRPR